MIEEEIDKGSRDHLEVLHKIVQALKDGDAIERLGRHGKLRAAHRDDLDWHAFIEQTYGSFAEDPLQRGPQGAFEIREAL